jgi:beta-lactamase regulating signal transducer with metallopeptidase domain
MSLFPMSVAGVEIFAQTAVERIVNSLPEGLLLALCAWTLLRLLGKQNAGTRFAVWLVTLVGVAGLPLLSGLEVGGRRLGAVAHAELTVPASWALAFVALWVPLAAVALARVLVGVWQVRAIRQSCNELNVDALDPAMRAVIEQTEVCAAGDQRHVRLLVSEHARVPAAIGFLDPAIVLPSWCLREMTPDELQPILIHELAHLRRRDDWTNLLQKAVRAVLFFHPAVWWIDARLSLEREMACDDAVLAHTGDARSYAGSLIGLLERNCSRRGWSMAQAAVAKAREATERIARILNGGAAATTRVGRGALGLAAGLCLAASGVLTVTPQLVGFGPASATAQAQLGNRPVVGEHVGLDAVVPAEEFTRAAAAVPATFHPAAAHHPTLAVNAVSARQNVNAPTTRPQQPVVSSQWLRASAPSVVLAKLDQMKSPSAQRQAHPEPTLQMVMVVETTYVQADPSAVRTASANATSATPAPVRAMAPGVLQVRTVQVLEEDDSGWHVHIYRVVTVVPVSEMTNLESST